MGKYIVKRVILAIFTIFIISLITFFAMNAIPGGPFNSEKAKSPAVMKELEARYGLDQPLIVQYKNYMAGVLHGPDRLCGRSRSGGAKTRARIFFEKDGLPGQARQRQFSYPLTRSTRATTAFARSCAIIALRCLRS